MKKLSITLLLVLCLLLSFTACNGKEEILTSAETKDETVESVTEKTDETDSTTDTD